MTVDVARSVAIRSEGTRLLFYGGHRPDQAEGYDVGVDLGWMEHILALTVERFPFLADMPLDTRASWAGTYDVSPDHTAIVGADPDCATWINACGFSGHGVMQAPEVGRIVAEQVTVGRISSLDASALSLARFTGDRPVAGIGLVL